MKKTAKFNIVFLLTLIILLSCAIPSFAAETDNKYRVDSVLCDGNEMNDVRNIVETDSGYWVCTKGGLYFVGNNGQVDQMFATELKTQFVYDIAVDVKGNCYITQGFTYAGGVNYGLIYISADGELLREFTAENSALPDNFVQAVEIDGKGRVWVGSGTGLSCYTPDTDQWKVYNKADGLSADSVNTLVYDEQNDRLWVGHYPDGTQGGLAGPFSGGWDCLQLNVWPDSSGLTVQYYDAKKNSELNSFLLGDFWVRGIALDRMGGAYIIRSGAAATYFGNPGYLGADGQPIDISACMGGRLDHYSSDGKLTQYTGRALLPAIDSGIKATDFVNNIPGATPELRMVAVGKDGKIWLSTSGLGVFCLDSLSGNPIQYVSSAGDFPNGFFDNIYALTALSNGSIAVGSQGGLRVLCAPSPKATISTHQVLIDGSPAEITAYNINGNNYFKLRDLADAMSDTSSHFAVTWDAATLTVNLTPGTAYTRVGGEGEAPSAGSLKIGASTHHLTINHAAVSAQSYNINGNNYFQLRDLGELLDFSVEWDEDSRTVKICGKAQ